jgi:L-cystine transport system permease protein
MNNTGGVQFFSWERMERVFLPILSSIQVTFTIVGVSFLLAFILSMALSLLRLKRLPVIEQLIKLYVSFIRGTPVVIQLYIIYYGLPKILWVFFHINIDRLDKIYFVTLTLALNEASFFSEIIRSSIQGVSANQLEAAYSVGLTYMQAFWRIIASQAFRIAVPSFCAEILSLFHSTSLAYLFGIMDLMGTAQKMNSLTHHQLEGYISVAVIFVVVSLLLEGLFRSLQNKKRRIFVVFFFDDFLKCFSSGIRYIPVTLYAVFIVFVLDIVTGTIIALLRGLCVPVAGRLFGFLFSIQRGMPPILTIILVHLIYTMKFADVVSFFHLDVSIRDVNIIYVGIAALFIFSLPFFSESIRGSLLSVGRSQFEAGFSVGLTLSQLFKRIIIPQMVPIAAPVLINNFVILIKASALLYIIGITDISNGSMIPAHITYGYFEGYVATGVIYWGICGLIELAGNRLEKRLGGIHDRT